MQPTHRHDMRPPSLQQCAVEIKRHIGTVMCRCVCRFCVHVAACYCFEHCRTVISKTAHFHCCSVLDDTCSIECGSSWFWFYVNRCIFAWICAKNPFHILLPVTFELWPCDLKLVLPVAPHVGDLSPKFERCTVFCFRLDGWHWTNRQTDRQTDGCNA